MTSISCTRSCFVALALELAVLGCGNTALVGAQFPDGGAGSTGVVTGNGGSTGAAGVTTANGGSTGAAGVTMANGGFDWRRWGRSWQRWLGHHGGPGRPLALLRLSSRAQS